MEKKQRKIDKKAFLEWFLVIITGIIINFLCVLIFSITSHASTYYNDDYFPMQQNQNNFLTETQLLGIENTFDSENNYIFVANIGVYSWGATCNVLVVPKSSETIPYAEVLSTGYQFSIYNIGSGGYSAFCYVYDNGGVEIYGSDFSVYQGLTSSLYSQGVDYVSNFRLYTNNSDNEVVLRYGTEEEVIDTGHATHPHFDGLHPHYGNTVNPPDEVPPTYTINNYSWTTYNNPPVDNSSTNALLESIFDILSYNAGYLQINISNEFDNLILNIKGLVDYVGETLQYYGDLIIANIQNGIQNFYDNMVSLVEPIHDKISALQEKVEEFADLFINPFDEEEFDEQIENSTFFTNYNAIIDNCEEISEIFDYAEERDHFSLYISFENPFADSEHKIIASEISFDWLVPLRSVYRPFIWACVLVELFIGGAKVLTRIIGGHGLG